MLLSLHVKHEAESWDQAFIEFNDKDAGSFRFGLTHDDREPVPSG
jgi:hypothetical protein